MRRPIVASVAPPRQAGNVALAALALGAYIVSTIKFQNRDPLSTEGGIQAILEICALGFGLAMATVVAIRRGAFPRVTPPAIGFAIFSGLAMLSSVFSYWPLLSVVKGSLLIVTLAIAVLVCDALGPRRVLTHFYWAVCGLLVIGITIKVLSQQPLFDIDDYSGRLRFTVFALHWGSLADLVALIILIGRLLPRRPPWFCQLFLLCVNLATGTRASTTSLLVVLLVTSLGSRRMTAKDVAIGAFGMAGAALAVLVIVNMQVSLSSIPFERFYGDRVTLEEIVTLNGRTDVWVESLPLVPGTLLFGYGMEGVRAALLREVEWAGHAHNAYLELLFAAGLPGLLTFLIAWGMAVATALRTPTDTRATVIGIYIYMFICGWTDPNLTLMQYLPVFLIVCIDANTREQASREVEAQTPLKSPPPASLDLAWRGGTS
jgi:O-antigen ligase